MWRHIGNSVIGSAHVDEGGQCQDYCLVKVFENGEAPVLMACIADGAGSSKFGADGSEMACESIVECVAAYLATHAQVDNLDVDDIRRWCGSVRQRIHVAAVARNTSTREFATTLCVAIVSPTRTAFFQVGDGAIVVRQGGVHGVVFWPQSGEYANTTNFLTDDEFEQRLEFQAVPHRVDDVAMFTDGIERLALSFSSQTPHPPFFSPLFEALRATADTDRLSRDMCQFLDSNSVRERSDDDKTLVLATWVDGEPSPID